jgi:hypothetical protein
MRSYFVLRRPSPAMVVACLSLLVVLGGTATAVTRLPARSVGTRELKPAAVGAAQLKSGAVTSPKIKADAVRPAHLDPQMFDALKTIPPNSIGSTKITDAGVMAVDIAPGAIGSSAILGGSITASDMAADGAAASPTLRSLGTGAQQAAAGNDARLSNSRTPTGAAGGSLAGTYPNPTLAAGSVGSSQVVDASLLLADWAVSVTPFAWPAFSVPGFSCFPVQVGGIPSLANLAGDVFLLGDEIGMPQGLVSQPMRQAGGTDATFRICNVTAGPLTTAGTSVLILVRP